MRGQSLIRPYPGRFFGVRLPFVDDAFYQAWKAEVAVKLWDPLSKTWWVPEDMLGAVMTFLTERGVAKLTDFARIEPTEPSPATPNSWRREDAKKTLGLQPDAPPGLVDAAYFYWKAQCSQAIGAGAQLARIEEAYAFLKKGGGA